MLNCVKLHAIFLFLCFDNPTFHSKDSYEKNKEQGQANTLEPQPGATENTRNRYHWPPLVKPLAY